MALDRAYQLPQESIEALRKSPQTTILLLMIQLKSNTAILTLEYYPDVLPDEANIHLAVFAVKDKVFTIETEEKAELTRAHLVPYLTAHQGECILGAMLTPFTTLPGDSDLTTSGELTMRQQTALGIQQQSLVDMQPNHAQQIIEAGDFAGNRTIAEQHINSIMADIMKTKTTDATGQKSATQSQLGSQPGKHAPHGKDHPGQHDDANNDP